MIKKIIFFFQAIHVTIDIVINNQNGPRDMWDIFGLIIIEIEGGSSFSVIHEIRFAKSEDTL